MTRQYLPCRLMSHPGEELEEEGEDLSMECPLVLEEISIEIQSLLHHLGVPANTIGEQGSHHRWLGEMKDQKVFEHIFCFAPK